MVDFWHTSFTTVYKNSSCKLIFGFLTLTSASYISSGLMHMQNNFQDWFASKTLTVTNPIYIHIHHKNRNVLKVLASTSFPKCHQFLSSQSSIGSIRTKMNPNWIIYKNHNYQLAHIKQKTHIQLLIVSSSSYSWSHPLTYKNMPQLTQTRHLSAS